MFLNKHNNFNNIPFISSGNIYLAGGQHLVACFLRQKETDEARERERAHYNHSNVFWLIICFSKSGVHCVRRRPSRAPTPLSLSLHIHLRAGHGPAHGPGSGANFQESNSREFSSFNFLRLKRRWRRFSARSRSSGFSRSLRLSLILSSRDRVRVRVRVSVLTSPLEWPQT